MTELLAPVNEERLALATEHDKRVRELEVQHTACWSEMAEVCIIVQDNQEWRDLGHSSFGAWLSDAAPHSRSAMYAAIGIVRELKEIPQRDLREIPLGSARVLSKMPKKLRGKRETIKRAKQRPKDFVKYVQEVAPNLHIESAAPRLYTFSKSQAEIVDGAIALKQHLEDLGSDEEALESMAADFLSENQELYKKLKSEGEL